MRGKIVRGIAGVYYVHCGDAETARSGKLYECKAKGVFRKDNRKPLVGDDVEIELLDAEKRTGVIRELLPRQSELIRPAVANVSQALVIFSVVKPKPSFNLLDRFLIMMRQQGIPCIVCFNKRDMDEEKLGESYRKVYADCGYRALLVSAVTKEGMEELGELLAGKITAVAGPSGVGKSSIVNCLQSGTVMETGQISAKIERGKHTTRHTELIALKDGAYILDTPGFSSLGLFNLEKEQLAAYYPEFAEYEQYCRFDGCEPVCGVKTAVAEGKISSLRYENYCMLYEELKNRKRY